MTHLSRRREFCVTLKILKGESVSLLSKKVWFRLKAKVGSRHEGDTILKGFLSTAPRTIIPNHFRCQYENSIRRLRRLHRFFKIILLAQLLKEICVICVICG